DIALNNLSEVLNTPLQAGGFALAGMGAGDLLRELEFYFPARDLDLAALASAFAGAGQPFAAYADDIAAMDARDVNGYLKGYIDMLFRRDGRHYILDWKSNWLGPDADAYSPAALDEAMRSHGYYLQACLYALALRRSMEVRWPDWDQERHFGGVFYVFTRGVDPLKPGNGVAAFRPPSALLDGIEAALGCGKTGL
ncbi:MAG: PD-(D/E)XK nuclease family protein, partial [Opitutales bacterium]